MEGYIRYAGYPGNISPVPGLINWKPIPDNQASVNEAIQEGYTAISTMAFEYPPEEGKPVPNRIGNLILDIDCKNNPEKAVQKTLFYLSRLEAKFGINLEYIKCWLSGNKGCHIEIPSILYGDTSGSPLLHLIHRNMVCMLKRFVFKPNDLNDEDLIDESMYSGGKGKLLRCENIKRLDNDKYKVPVTIQELFTYSFDKLWELTNQPRTVPYIEPIENCTSIQFSDLFRFAQEAVGRDNSEKNIMNLLDSLFKCSFIEHCYVERECLEEPEWFKLMSILGNLGNEGKVIAHLFSRDYPNYTEEETNKKLITSSRYSISCESINEIFTCNRTCEKEVKNPIDLWQHSKSSNYKASKNFVLQDDGLYYTTVNLSGVNSIKICSWIRIKAKIASQNDDDYSYLVQFKNDCNNIKTVRISWMDLVGRTDNMIQKLMFNGLRIYGEDGVKLLRKYFSTFSDDIPTGELVYRTGWTEDNTAFVLPNGILGNNNNKIIYYESNKESLVKSKGTLDKWKKNVVELSTGNDIFVLTLSFGFVGPLLKLLDIESFGIHLMEESSHGKSTAALVAGSIYGGGSLNDKGYCHQWKATGCSIEPLAESSNDLMLILDELGEAEPEDVYKTAYMISNGSGKLRCNRDMTLRRTYRWRTALLSTGEMTISQKINSSNRVKSMPGIEVRILSLPLNINPDSNVFTSLHGIETPSDYSKAITRNAKQYYGTAIIDYVEKIFKNLSSNIDLVNDKIHEFKSRYSVEGYSGQIIRVIEKFAVIYAAGVLAHEFDLLPFTSEEIERVVSLYLQAWIRDRNGVEDKEIIELKERVLNFFGQYRNTFLDLNGISYNQSRTVDNGYYWYNGGKRLVIITNTDVIKKLRGNMRDDRFVKILQKLGWIENNSKGRPMRSKHHPRENRNLSGLVFNLSAFESENIEDESDIIMPKIDAANTVPVIENAVFN